MADEAAPLAASVSGSKDEEVGYFGALPSSEEAEIAPNLATPADSRQALSVESPKVESPNGSWLQAFFGIQPRLYTERTGGLSYASIQKGKAEDWDMRAVVVGVMVGVCVSVLLWLIADDCETIRDSTRHKGADGDWGMARPLKNLDKDIVILISSDGFRWGYNFKVPTPNIERLRSNGTEAREGMFPVFPSVTFPNHYSMATGLYPAWHGIVMNHFTDPTIAGKFAPGNNNAEWWLGEPIWETAVKEGVPAATFFWPGSDVTKGEWKCTPDHCALYNGSVPYEERVDTVLGYMDLPKEQRPRLVTLYFEEPDHTGHELGPDAPQIDDAIIRVDAMIGRLLDGLQTRDILEDVHVILVGDHGMAGVCDGREIYLEDMVSPELLENVTSWVETKSPVLAIRPPPGVDMEATYMSLNTTLSLPGVVENGQFFKLYRKQDLPPRFHYIGSDRIQPIIGIAAEGYSIQIKRKDGHRCGGQHGFDNRLLSMRTIFIASGPHFAKGRQVDSFQNVEVYNIVCTILGIKPAPNNGTDGFPNTILLST